MRLVAPLVLLLALVFGQARGLVTLAHHFTHAHTHGLSHPIVADPHIPVDAGTEKHDHKLLVQGHGSDPGCVLAAFALDVPVLLPQSATPPVIALAVPRAEIHMASGINLPNAPPPERPSRAPPFRNV